MARQHLDQYYTKPAIAQECWEIVRGLLWQIGWDRDNIFVIEPSAGRGAFLDAVGSVPTLGVELDPSLCVRSDILCADFLDRAKWEEDYQSLRRGLMPVVIGNPPFGRKGDIAVDFLNAALDLSGVVGMILPLGFRKWSSQSRVRHGAHLLIDRDLPEEAFFAGGKDFALRCCFQVWTRADVGVPEGYHDVRLLTRPSAMHEDFDAWQYNRTPEAEKYFEYDWDFAVLRQGYGDYRKRYFDRADLDRKQQWIFFKAHTETARRRLLSIDFHALSRRNIGLPGFGKADVVQAYEQLPLRRSASKSSTSKAPRPVKTSSPPVVKSAPKKGSPGKSSIARTAPAKSASAKPDKAKQRKVASSPQPPRLIKSAPGYSLGRPALSKPTKPAKKRSGASATSSRRR